MWASVPLRSLLRPVTPKEVLAVKFDDVLVGVNYVILLRARTRTPDFEVLWGAPPLPAESPPDIEADDYDDAYDDHVEARTFWRQREKECWPRPFHVFDKTDPWALCYMAYWDPPMTRPADPVRWERDARVAAIRIHPRLFFWSWEQEQFSDRVWTETPPSLDEETRQQIVIEREIWGASETELFLDPS
jgi:hypothetical protein